MSEVINTVWNDKDARVSLNLQENNEIEMEEKQGYGKLR